MLGREESRLSFDKFDKGFDLFDSGSKPFSGASFHALPSSFVHAMNGDFKSVSID